MLTEPQLRNRLADALDKMKESMASRRTEYIEGETFQFAEDPELEALRFAEEQLQESIPEPDVPEPTDEKPEPPREVDFNQICENIVLRDIEEN